MKDLLALLAHLLTTIAKLPGPGGAKAVVADSLLMKQQPGSWAFIGLIIGPSGKRVRRRS